MEQFFPETIVMDLNIKISNQTMGRYSKEEIKSKILQLVKEGLDSEETLMEEYKNEKIGC